MPSARFALILAFTAIYLIWGSTYLGIRVAVETIPPFLMGSLRFATAGALLLLYLRLSRGPLGITRRQLRDNAIIGGFLLLGGNGLVSWAEQYIPSSIAALIVGSQPLIMVMTEWAWPKGPRPATLTVLGLFLGFAGVTWLIAPWHTTGSDALNVPASLVVLMACICWAFGSIYGRNAKEAAAPFICSALQMLSGAALLGLVALFRGEWAAWHPSNVSVNSWWALVYLTFVGSLIGFSTFAWLMKHSTPALVSTYAYVNPIVAVFLGWLLLSEPISPRLLSASAIIIVSVALINFHRFRTASA